MRLMRPGMSIAMLALASLGMTPEPERLRLRPLRQFNAADDRARRDRDALLENLRNQRSFDPSWGIKSKGRTGARRRQHAMSCGAR